MLWSLKPNVSSNHHPMNCSFQSETSFLHSFLSARPQIDLQKMPLGKLSKRQIQSAYALLTEVQQVSSQWLHFSFHFFFLGQGLWDAIAALSSVTGRVRCLAGLPHPGPVQSLLHADPSRLWNEEAPAAQQPRLHPGRWTHNSVPLCPALFNQVFENAHVAVQAKVQMLDNLLDIEVAYSLLRGGAQDNDNDPIDINYEKLKTQIEVRSPGYCHYCVIC